MKEWQEKKDINFREYFSPQFIYNLRENSESEGMYGRDVMRILSKIGSVDENTYNYGNTHMHRLGGKGIEACAPHARCMQNKQTKNANTVTEFYQKSGEIRFLHDFC